MNIARSILAGVSILTLVAGVAMAQYKNSANRMTGDNSFITKALEGGMVEIEMGQLALTHASDSKVKQFGQRMVDDHTKANDELKRIAGPKGVTVPSAVSAKDKAAIDRLSKLNGKAFDRAYMRDMVRDHREDVSEFKHEATSGADPDVKAFASKTTPTLEDHLKSAEATLKEVEM